MLLAEATRLPHLSRFPPFLYHPTESGTSAAIPPFDTVINATVSVDTSTWYDLRLAQSTRKNKVCEARRFLRLYMYQVYVMMIYHTSSFSLHFWSG